MKATLSCSKLKKIYNKREVVKNSSIEVRQGEIVGLLGPNGAGKTTTFYMIVGWLEKKAGIKVIGIEGGLRSTVMPNPEEQLFEGSLILGIGDAPSIKKFIRLI